MADPRSVATPRGLGARGRRLWKEVTKGYRLRPDELILLETAARTLDRVTALDDAMVGQPLTTVGSMGQQREHPLLSEARQQRALLNRTLAQLDLPDVDDATGAINQQRSAAQSRWARAHGAS